MNEVDGEYPPHVLRGSTSSPKPQALSTNPDRQFDRVLKRAALNGGWLTYFYAPEGFAQSWAKVRGFAEAAGRNSDALLNANQLAIYVGASRAARRTSNGSARNGITRPRPVDKDSAVIGTVDDASNNCAPAVGLS